MGLKGTLAELPLADLVEMASLGGKTGRLRLFDEEGATAGELTFRDGRLAGAVCGELGAEKAFYALLALRHGSFDFDPAAELEEGGCDLPTQSLIMEAMRRLDETRRLRDELPASAGVVVLAGEAEDELEARILAHRDRWASLVGDVVESLLVGGDADEHDALRTLQRLAARGVVRVRMPKGFAEPDQGDSQGTST